MSRPKLVPELLCSDLSASLDFYVRLLGFHMCYDRPEEGFAYLDLDGAEIMLEEAQPGDPDPRVWWTGPPEKPYGRGINFEIEVTDVDGLHGALSKADWPLFRPMEEQWYRAGDHYVGNRQFLVQDPDGYLLRFCTDLGEKPLAP